MKGGPRRVCGGDHRVALVAMASEVSHYWKTTALLAATFGAGAGLAAPVLLLHRRLVPAPAVGGDLGLVWRAGVQPVAVTQQRAVDALGGVLVGITMATLGVAAITILALALARENERAAEVLVRRAVGAGRRTLLGSAVAEAGLIVLVGVAVGALLGTTVAGAAGEWPGALRPGGVSLAVGAVLMLAAMVLAGLLLPVALPRRRIGVAEPRSPAPLTPTALQIGATLVALTSGSLLAGHARGFEPGADHPVPQGYLSGIELPGHAAAERAAHYSELLRLGGPASLTSPGAVAGLGPVSTVTTDCGQCSEGGLPLRWRVKPATHQVVSADTFEMLGIRVLQGRAITEEDSWEAARVAVINRSLAAREFQDGQALGRHIKVVDDGEQWSTVVGVVDDPPASGLGASLQPHYTVYLSVLQHPPASAELMTRGMQGGVASVPVRQLLAAQAAPLAWFAHRLGEQGRAMLAIAVLGSLAVARLWVVSLLVELGVHRALGARRRTIVRFVLVRATAVCVAGLVLGIWFGAAVWGILGGLVEGLPPWDPAAVLRFGAILLASTLLGALPPVRRAARATPASLIATP